MSRKLFLEDWLVGAQQLHLQPCSQGHATTAGSAEKNTGVGVRLNWSRARHAKCGEQSSDSPSAGDVG